MLRRAFLLTSFVSLAPLHAQGVFAGMLVDPKTRTPLPCVDVSLEDSTAHEVAHALTMSDGAFQFDAPPKGSYRTRFSVWHHAPVYTEYEMLDSTTERARAYEIDFGPIAIAKAKTWADSADAPPGKPLHMDKVQPKYPLRLRGVEGNVSMRYAVDSTGRVVQSSIQVLQASHPDFAAAIVEYLREVQYEPARRAGRPVCALQTDWPFTFSMAR